jgi:hypothetical protein
MTAGRSGRRQVPPQDVARFWQARASGMSIKDAAKIAGVHYNTAQKWDAKKKIAKAEIEVGKLEQGTARKKVGGVQADAWAKVMDVSDLPPVIPYDRLSEEAQRGLVDFDYFRRRYLGRIPSPWQVDAAYKIEAYLLSNDKQFVVLNCPPGAGKSTLFHDIAVWQIVKNRKIRVMIGSVSQSLAKMYSRRIRETLERQFPLDPDPVLIDKSVWRLTTVGLSLQLQGRCGGLKNSLLNRRTWVGWITRNQLFLLTVLSLNSLVIVPICVCLMTLHHRRTLKNLRQETNSLRDGIQWLKRESIQAVCSPSSDNDLDRWTSTLIVSAKSPTKISRMTMTDQIQRTFHRTPNR